jgi:hypothetical protein
VWVGWLLYFAAVLPHLGGLTRIVPFELVDAVLAETATVQAGLRELPSRVGMYFVLAMCQNRPSENHGSGRYHVCRNATATAQPRHHPSPLGTDPTVQRP